MPKNSIRFFLLCLVLSLWGSSAMANPGLAQSGGLDGFQKPAPDHGPIGSTPMLDVSGSSSSQTPASPASPAYAREWSRMAFQSYQAGNWEIIYAYATNSSPVNLTNSLEADSRPSLSQDNTRVAYNSNPSGNVDIYVVNTDGTTRQRLTIHDFQDYAPAWSPDGKSIAFVSNRNRGSNTEPGEIYSMNADGSAQTRLTINGEGNDNPSWSPDGSQIAWVVYSGVYGSIHVMNADGSNQHAITPMLPFLDNPAWSPSGSRIAFDCDFDGDGWNEIVTMNPDGTNLQIAYDIGTSSQDAKMGAWLSNEEQLYFSLIKYILYQGTYYIESSYIHFLHLSTKFSSNISSSGYDMNPSLVGLDDLLPVSSINPLPPLSRSNGFFLNWQAQDYGPSGIFEFILQYRLESSGDWQDFAHYVPGPEPLISFTGQPGKTIYFRSSVVDNAENKEAWPSFFDGDAHTSFFSHTLGGSVRDERDFPLADTTLDIQPAPWESNLTTDVDGTFLAHMKQFGQAAIGANNLGFEPVTGVNLDTAVDTAIQINLPPKNNQLQNGGFEAGLTGWTITGIMTTTTGKPYSQLQSARLGNNCDEMCLTGPDRFARGTIYSFPAAASDKDGNLHAIWDSRSYSIRDVTGVWSPVETLADHGQTGFVGDNKSAIVVDQFGTVSVAAMGRDGIYYYRKPSDGTWTNGENLGKGYSPDIAVDSHGTVYIIFVQQGGNIVYRKRNLSGVWEPPVLINARIGGRIPSQVVIGPDDNIHFFSSDSDNDIFQRDLLPDGTLSAREFPLGVLESYSILRAQVDQSNRIHLLVQNWSNNFGTRHFYVVRNEFHQWSSPKLIGGAVEVDLTISENGDAYFARSIANNRNQIAVSYLPFGTSVIQDYLISIPSSSLQDIEIASDRSTVSIIFASDSSINLIRTASAGYEFELISQTITLPSDLNKPTLAFMAKLEGKNEQLKSWFEVSIGSGITETQIFSTTQAPEWSHYWHDLSAWAGKTITVTFILHQAGSQPYNHLLLDNVSIGAWLTPLPESVSPSQITENWASTMITITGDNFIEKPDVYIDNFLALDVVRVDEHTLQVFLPPGTAPGIYTIKVQNPGGQASLLRQRLLLGNALFLPIVSRR